MTQFIQLHLLVSYPPANLNRDDLGRPKTAKMGGAERLRVSSQSLKRAWRTSDVFEDIVKAGQTSLPELVESFSHAELKPPARHIGIRTRALGEKIIIDCISTLDVNSEKQREWQQLFSLAIGEATLSKSNVAESEESDKSTLAFLSDFEIANILKLIKEIPFYINGSVSEKSVLLAKLEKSYQTAITATGDNRKKAIKKLSEVLFEEISVPEEMAVDIAMFGRMLAINPATNIEAAVQVAHAIGVHASTIEDDYFTAVDDLNRDGAGHVNEAGFAAAVFYQYLCINRDQLLKNLGGNEDLLKRALTALVEAVLTVGPSGKQNSFASRAYVHYALAETGSQQPRSLSLAFLKPIDDKQTGYGEASIKALQTLRDNMDKVYGQCADASAELNVFAASGSKQAVLDLVAGA